MKFSTTIVLFLMASGSSWAAAKVSGWHADPGHRPVQYRVKCSNGAATIEWRNGYANEVKFKASVWSGSYDGTEDVRIEGHGTARSSLDTMYCSPTSIHVKVVRFTKVAAHRAPRPQTAGLTKAPKEDTSCSGPPVPTPATPAPYVSMLVRFEPATEKIPEISREALNEIRVGMKKQQVVQKLGVPLSRLSIPEESRLIETYRYNLVHSKLAVVRFSNGAVSDISAQE